MDTLTNKTLIIGIDPDTVKNGVAVYSTIHKEISSLLSLPFFELYAYLKQFSAHISIVIIEAGWENRSNWHKLSKGSASINAKIGERTGANFETGKKIVEMCNHLGIPCKAVKPLKKIWNGPDKKITKEEFIKVTGFKRLKTNQEQRDAGLLAWAYKDTKL